MSDHNDQYQATPFYADINTTTNTNSNTNTNDKPFQLFNDDEDHPSDSEVDLNEITPNNMGTTRITARNVLSNMVNNPQQNQSPKSSITSNQSQQHQTESQRSIATDNDQTNASNPQPNVASASASSSQPNVASAPSSMQSMIESSKL